MAVSRLEHEKMHEDEIINSKFDGSKEKYAMKKFTYFECYECSKPYFGGLYECAEAMDVAIKLEELICN